MIDDPAKAIRRAVLVAKGLSRAIGPMPGKDEGERVHPASLLPGVHVQAFAGGGEVQPTDETGFDAFHGTPHSFEPEPGAPLGRFRSDKIGTGEGAQAFGHGAYVAGNEGIAKHYKDALTSGAANWNVDGKSLATLYTSTHPDDRLKYEIGLEVKRGKPLEDAIDFVKNQYQGKLSSKRTQKEEPENIPHFQNALERLDYFKKNPLDVQKNEGHLYHVRVNANPEHFLDWDKPLREQHPHVQQAVRAAWDKKEPYTILDPHGMGGWREGVEGEEVIGRHVDGEDVLNAFTNHGNDPIGGPRALHAAGIPGIRYLDANSRGPTGNPTHNHVIFDPSIIDIKRRYKRGGGVHGYKTDGFVPSGGEVSGYKDVPFQHIEKRSPGWGATWTPLETVSEKIGNLNKISKNAANYGDFMNSMAHKASTQGLSPRDLIKAYLMTISSQGRAAVTPHTILKNWPEYPGPTHENIRPEGAMGEWLSSPIGKRYLDNAEQGKIDQGAIDHALNAFKGFGKVNDAEGTALPWAVHSLAPHTKIVSDMIAASLKGKHPAEDWRNWVKENVNGVGFAKAGFWGSMLGRGDQGVPDARQLVLNTPNKSQEATNLIGVGESRPANLREKEAMQRLMDRQRALSFAIPKELAPHYHALAHHTIWDAAEGTDTTHQDVINAMQHAATGGTIHPAHEHPLARAMREIGMPGLDGHYDNIDHALSVVRSHKPHRR